MAAIGLTVDRNSFVNKSNHMQILELIRKELDNEAVTTRKMLERVPADKLDWQPHPKSMTLRQLSTHIAELPGWIEMAFTSSELDFATADYQPKAVEGPEDILSMHQQSLEKGRSSLQSATLADLEPTWTLRTGDTIHSVMTKYDLVRLSISQTIHHRAQLGVYLRLLDIPIPGSYGPSADDNAF